MNNPSPALDVLLRCSGLTRRWGGLVAVNDVAVELVRGTVHAVIGTNGAGKSTLINLLSGEIAPSGGRIELMGQEVTQWTQPRRARAGLGRSYQRNTIFPEFSVLENCRLTAQSRWQRPWRWWQSAWTCADSHAAAREAAASAGLSEKAFYLGRNVHDHLATSAHNLEGAGPPMLERCVHYENLTPEACRSLMVVAERSGMRALRAVNDRVQAGGATARPGEPVWRMNFGVYYFMEPAEADPPEGNAVQEAPRDE